MSKIGQGAFEAWLRAGHKEVTQILPAFPDSIRPVEEPGLPGNLTPQEVVAQKNSHEMESPENAPVMTREDPSQRMQRQLDEAILQAEPELER